MALTIREMRRDGIQRQVRRLDGTLKELNATVDQLATLRLLSIAVGFGLTVVLYFVMGLLVFWISLALTISVFSGLVVFHARIRRAAERTLAWRKWKAAQIARMDLDWEKLPAALQTTHPLEIDLDLLQVHRLLNTAASHGGGQRLHEWLLNERPDLSAIERRQALVRELGPMTIFRGKLILQAVLAARDLREQREGQRILEWLNEQSGDKSLRTILLILAALVPVNIILFALSSFGLLPPIWVVSWFIYAAIFLNQMGEIGVLFQRALTLEDSLRKLGAVLHYVEQYPYGDKQHLRELCRPVIEAEPSHQLRRVTWVVSAAGLRQNPILWTMLNAVIPWDVYFAHRLNLQKAELAEKLPAWLEVWFELEAVCSLANFAYLNPDYAFPQISENAVFKAQAIGHPLIPHASRVANDFVLGQVGEVVVITGSNMAGKSSFLRTLGVNLCLAYAGGVVCAGALEIGLFRLFSCIRVTDSLNDGISYFYAEVKRLKALVDSLRVDDPLPLFFLIDEIFRGTNNRERLIGSRSYIQALANGHGLGLIATHDLELVKLADENPCISNYHFREEVLEGRMVFDYHLRPGPCPTTNALRIMAMEGLPVEKEALEK
ncbi:MAG: hypothetical protein HY862_22270 [Chloroflexi bacterium]|nr:hypothetical protein [Chloroflexota bacterium]